jgi:FixJ family two-component response regulator
MDSPVPESKKVEQTSKGPCVLLLEDDAGVRRSLHLLLRANGFDVRSHESAVTLLADPATAEAHVLVADYRLRDGNGVDVLRSLQTSGWKGPAVLITGALTPELYQEAVAAGYVAVFDKPVVPHELIHAIGTAISAD